MEHFIDIPGYEGVYQISNLGNIKSLERKDWRNSGANRIGCWVSHKEKILSPQMDKSGYLHVRLKTGNKIVLWKVHQLVALAFFGHDRKNIYSIVHHINGNKTDNRVENLIVLSKSEHAKLHEVGKNIHHA